MNITIVGAGNMGAGFVKQFTSAGHKVRVYNRTGQKAQAWMEAVGQEHGASAHEEPAEAARGADVVISCIGGDHDLRAVVAAADQNPA